MSTPPTPPAAGGDTGLAENVAGLLSYVAGWITGLIFFLIDKRPFVRFHAAQSMVLFGGLFVLYWVLTFIIPFMGLGLLAFWGIFSMLLWLLMLVLWIVCMVKAYQGQRFRVPLVADIADSIAK